MPRTRRLEGPAPTWCRRKAPGVSAFLKSKITATATTKKTRVFIGPDFFPTDKKRTRSDQCQGGKVHVHRGLPSGQSLSFPAPCATGLPCWSPSAFASDRSCRALLGPRLFAQKASLRPTNSRRQGAVSGLFSSSTLLAVAGCFHTHTHILCWTTSSSGVEQTFSKVERCHLHCGNGQNDVFRRAVVGLTSADPDSKVVHGDEAVISSARALCSAGRSRQTRNNAAGRKQRLDKDTGKFKVKASAAATPRGGTRRGVPQTEAGSGGAEQSLTQSSARAAQVAIAESEQP